MYYGEVYAPHLWTSKQHYIFPSSKRFPEGTTRKLHCFFEGSVQLHVPKSTWLPGRPFWSLVSEQLRRSSFGILLCTVNGLHVLRHISRVLSWKELSLLYYLYIKGMLTSVRIRANQRSRLRHQMSLGTMSMVTRGTGRAWGQRRAMAEVPSVNAFAFFSPSEKKLFGKSSFLKPGFVLQYTNWTC